LVQGSEVSDKRLAEEELAKLKLPKQGESVYDLYFWTDSSLIVGGFAVSLALNSLSYSIIRQRCPCDRGEVNPVDMPVVVNNNKTADIMANYTVALAMVAPVAIDYFDIGFGKAFAEDMVVYTEVLSLNFGLVSMAKFGFQRPYPYVYQKPPQGFQSDPTDYLSFYSGHTSTTFAALGSAAMTLSLRHKKILWPWLMTAAAGTSIGLELILSGEHFTTDVLVGAMMGSAIGFFVPGLHAKNNQWQQQIYFASNRGIPEAFWKMDF